MWRYVIGLNLLILIWAGFILFGFPVAFAVVGTLMIVLTLVMMLVIGRLMARKGAKEIEAALGNQAEAQSKGMRPDRQVEIKEMRSQFTTQLSQLKSSKLGGGGRSALYKLPWYMIIGPPGGGKSTALRNSGLHFPSKTGAVRGIGGTRNCDWWFANEAIILDTAGRYATQEKDKQEWTAFLNILRKHRKRKPINGLLVAVPVTDIGGHSEDEISALAGKIRDRIDEVTERLQVVVPVYMLFTKCDLVPGFIETFGPLRKADRGQVWGSTFPIDQGGQQPSELFSTSLHDLQSTLEQRMVVRLEEERHPEVRDHVFQFPQQFHKLRPNLIQFMEELFVGDVYREPPKMRGVYFSSGTQEGNPVDLLASSMAKAFGVGAQTKSAGVSFTAKSYFLRDLFGKVVFPDQDVAARSTKGRRSIILRQVAVAVGSLVTALLLTVLPLQSYYRNKTIVDSTEEIIKTVVEERTKHKDEVIPPNLLESLRRRLTEFKAWEADAPPLDMRYGMFQGDTLFPPVRRYYIRTLQKELLGPIVQHDVKEMRTLRQVYGFDSRPSDKEYKRFFNKLKTHLLLTVPHADGEPTIEGETREWLIEALAARWSLALGTEPSPETRAQMAKDFNFYLDLLESTPDLAIGRDNGAVRDTRAVLNRVSYAEAIVKQVVLEAASQDRDLTVRRVMGGAVTPIASDRDSRVRAAFTRWGWENVVRERLEAAADEKDRWVFGKGGDREEGGARFVAEMRSAFFQQYIEEWSDFLDSLRIKQTTDLPEALAMLRDLTRGQPPPLKRLMKTVAENVNLPQPAAPGGAVGAAAAEAGGELLLRRIKQKFGGRRANALGKVGNAAKGSLGKGDSGLLGEEAIADAFREFYEFGYVPPPPDAKEEDGQEPEPEAVPLDIVQEQYVSLRDALATFVEDRRAAGKLMSQLQKSRTAVNGVLNQLQASAWRPRISALVWPPIKYTSQSLVGLKSDEGRKWCTSVVAPYVRSLQGRYPFRARKNEALISDVAEFLKPKSGILWGFYKSDLAGDILQSGSSFRFDGRSGGMLAQAYSPELPAYLQRAYRVTSALFPPGAAKPRLDFDIRLLASPAFSAIAFQIGEESFRYVGGPERWKRVSWPGAKASSGVELKATGRGGVEDVLRFTGEWGLFRLFEGGEIIKRSAGYFRIRWKLKRTGQWVSVDVRPAGTATTLLGVKVGKGQKRLRLTFGDLTPPYSIARGGSPCNP